jgi:CheY-like chemotaxis protein
MLGDEDERVRECSAELELEAADEARQREVERVRVHPDANVQQEGEAEPGSPPRETSGPGRSRPLCVLVAEDNATNRTLAVCLLKKAGHTVETACTGKEALAALAKRSFDVVFMDVQMPEMDGFEATARIREQERATGAHIPIVAMTAYEMEEDCARCREAGMDGYVCKPISAQALYHALASCVSSDTQAGRNASARLPSEGADTRQAANAGTDSQAAGLPPLMLDKAALLARVGGREDRLRTIIQVFLEESAGLMAELRAAITAGDASSLKRAAHSLKGALGIFAVPSVLETACTLESLSQAGELAGAAEAYSRLEEKVGNLKSALAAVVSACSEVRTPN